MSQTITAEELGTRLRSGEAIELIDEAEWNPNEEQPAEFNALVENIREVGMVEFPVVVPKGGRYLAVSGNHRVRAAKLLGLSFRTLQYRLEKFNLKKPGRNGDSEEEPST